MYGNGSCAGLVGDSMQSLRHLLWSTRIWTTVPIQFTPAWFRNQICSLLKCKAMKINGYQRVLINWMDLCSMLRVYPAIKNTLTRDRGRKEHRWIIIIWCHVGLNLHENSSEKEKNRMVTSDYRQKATFLFVIYVSIDDVPLITLWEYRVRILVCIVQ